MLIDASCHRIGGGNPSNLKLRPAEEKLHPPGISVLIGGTPEQAAADFRRVFGPHSSLGTKAGVIGTAVIDAIRNAGFDVVEDPSNHFPSHGRLIHPTDGAAGFNDENLLRLSDAFTNRAGL
jgi:hypothetical protein